MRALELRIGSAEMTSVALRPYLPDDAETLAELFRESVWELAADDYDDEQRAAWAAQADDEAAFGRRLAGMLTLVAIVEDEVVGFASLAKDVLDMLYVRPDAARMGVATTLVDALEKLAGARGVTQIKTEASETANAFFAGRNYQPLTRNTRLVGDEWLANTSMKKDIPANANVKGAKP
jgi:putative acetyltransferase